MKRRDLFWFHIRLQKAVPSAGPPYTSMMTGRIMGLRLVFL